MNQDTAPADTKVLVKVAKALSDPTRLRLLQEIGRCAIRVCGDLFQHVPISQPSMSQHLKVLLEAGLIKSHREGRTMRLTIVPARLQELEIFVRALHVHP